MLRDALRASPVFFAANVLDLLEIGDSLAEALEDANSLADTFLDIDIAETTNALHVIASTTHDEFERARILKALQTRTQPVHPAIGAFGQVEVVESLHLGSDLFDGYHSVLLLRWPDGTEASLIIMVTSQVQGVISDVILDENRHELTKANVEEVASDAGAELIPMPLGIIGDDLADAATRYAELPEDEQPVSEGWPALKGFLTYVLGTMPEATEEDFTSAQGPGAV